VPGPDGVLADCETPRAMTLDDIVRVSKEFAQAASNARTAGVDGIELHCASGYLINQFLNLASNKRDDDFGGSIEKRIAFPVRILQSLADAIGRDRVGFRISPGNPYNGMDSTNPEPLFVAFVAAANQLNLAYIHVIDLALESFNTLAMVKANWSGVIMSNNNLKADSAAALLREGRADAVSFGRAFIANPDLPARIRAGAALVKPDYGHLYSGEEIGYLDYPKHTVQKYVAH
jgi:N-ethylmaleimide reductase